MGGIGIIQKCEMWGPMEVRCVKMRRTVMDKENQVMGIPDQPRWESRNGSSQQQ
jgi:hypothetical protein